MPQFINDLYTQTHTRGEWIVYSHGSSTRHLFDTALPVNSVTRKKNYTIKPLYSEGVLKFVNYPKDILEYIPIIL